MTSTAAIVPTRAIFPRLITSRNPARALRKLLSPRSGLSLARFGSSGLVVITKPTWLTVASSATAVTQRTNGPAAWIMIHPPNAAIEPRSSARVGFEVVREVSMTSSVVLMPASTPRPR